MKKRIFLFGVLSMTLAINSIWAQSELDKLQPYLLSTEQVQSKAYYKYEPAKKMQQVKPFNGIGECWVGINDKGMTILEFNSSGSLSDPLTEWKMIGEDMYLAEIAGQKYVYVIDNLAIFQLKLDIDYNDKPQLKPSNMYMGGVTSDKNEYMRDRAYIPDSWAAVWQKEYLSESNQAESDKFYFGYTFVDNAWNTIASKYLPILEEYIAEGDKIAAAKLAEAKKARELANKEYDRIEAEKQAEFDDYCETNPDAKLSFEENFNKWHAKGTPLMTYFKGMSGFYKSPNQNLRSIEDSEDYTILRTEKQPSGSTYDVVEYEGKGVPANIRLLDSKKLGVKYITMETDSYDSYSALLNYKKSYFYNRNGCNSNNCEELKKIKTLREYEVDTWFWYKGNLILYRNEKGMGGEDLIMVFSYPGSTPIDDIVPNLWDDFVVKYLFWLQSKERPKY